MVVANCRRSFFNDKCKGSVARHHHLRILLEERGIRTAFIFATKIDAGGEGGFEPPTEVLAPITV
jgi:hypothetical protein